MKEEQKKSQNGEAKTPEQNGSPRNILAEALDKMEGLTTEQEKSRAVFGRAVDAILSIPYEKFEEYTYNKRLGKLNSQHGDQTLTSESALIAVRKAQHSIDESNALLSKLYNAPAANLWYRPYSEEELYTSIKSDYRQTLKKQYQERFQSLRKVDAQMKEVEVKLNSIRDELQEQTTLDEREAVIAKKVSSTKTLNALQTQRDKIADDLIKIDTDLIRAAFDDHDRTVSVKRNSLTPRLFRQVWNEKIMNPYEKDKIQYLTSVEKKQYFKDKVRELKKCDPYGVLNHPDWFFRIVVIDFISAEMQRLIAWFKTCSYDDYDTVYRIVRKLNLLQLDIDAATSSDNFDINKTNLFHLSDEDLKSFDKLDKMLNENTLYELIQGQVRMTSIVPKEDNEVSEGQIEEGDKTLIEEQESEENIERQRSVRDDVVVRVWGSESNLTKAAYDCINQDEVPDLIFTNPNITKEKFDSIKEMKEEIIDLKLNTNRESEEDERLQNLLGAFANMINDIKEMLVMEAMNKM